MTTPTVTDIQLKFVNKIFKEYGLSIIGGLVRKYKLENILLRAEHDAKSKSKNLQTFVETLKNIMGVASVPVKILLNNSGAVLSLLSDAMFDWKTINDNQALMATYMQEYMTEQDFSEKQKLVDNFMVQFDTASSKLKGYIANEITLEEAKTQLGKCQKAKTDTDAQKPTLTDDYDSLFMEFVYLQRQVENCDYDLVRLTNISQNKSVPIIYEDVSAKNKLEAEFNTLNAKLDEELNEWQKKVDKLQANVDFSTKIKNSDAVFLKMQNGSNVKVLKLRNRTVII